MKMLVALGLVAVAACGGGGDDGSAYEGIYEVDSWTLNDASCDAAGDDVLADQTSTTFYVKEENFLGAKAINVKFCADVAECEELAGEVDTIHIGMHWFEDGSDADGWHSEYFAGFASGGVCDGVYRVTTLTGDGQTVRIESRDTESTGFAPGSDGFCEDEDGKLAAEGQPCVQLEVVTASRISDLP